MSVMEREWDRAAVVTIEGGGVYGLSVLGQLQGVLDSGLAPVALAGTSAGAIVAALYWAGYTPIEVRQKFTNLAEAGKLVGLLGDTPDADAGSRLASFERLAKRVANSILGVSHGSEKTRARSVCCSWFCRLLYPLRWIVSYLWAFLSRACCLAWCLTVGAWQLHGYAHGRGLFSGQVLVDVVDEWIRQGPQLQAKGIVLRPGVTFRDIRDVMRKHEDIYYPPLFLTATELETGKLVLFNSIDDECLDIPIAQAVRASAGFPVVFQPQAIAGTRYAGLYADGGLVSNFPSWIYSYEFRRRLRDYHETVVTPQGKSIRKDRYRGVASLPWIHVGLRTQDPPQATAGERLGWFEVLRSLFKLCTGQARDQLETIISTFIARSAIVQQSLTETGGPSHVMAIGEVDSRMVDNMFARGRQAAITALTGLTFKLPSEEGIKAELEKLVTQANLILGHKGDNSRFEFRSNVFTPCQDKLCLQYSFNMDSELDCDRALEFDLSAGLTGFCFSSRSPQICNLGQIANLAASETRAMFGMTPEQHAMVRTDRTWLASMPIFDPGDTVVQAGFETRPVPAGGKRYCTIPSMLDGGLLGVLNLDAKISCGEMQIPVDAELQWKNVHIQAILDVMQGAAFRIGEILAMSFAVRPQDKRDG